MRPLTVPKLQVTPATSGEASDPCVEVQTMDRPPTARPSGTRLKKKK